MRTCEPTSLKMFWRILPRCVWCTREWSRTRRPKSWKVCKIWATWLACVVMVPMIAVLWRRPMWAWPFLRQTPASHLRSPPKSKAYHACTTSFRLPMSLSDEGPTFALLSDLLLGRTMCASDVIFSVQVHDVVQFRSVLLRADAVCHPI